MALLLLIRLATIIFYSRTFWNVFKALKVPKRRRKIPRPVIHRSSSTSSTIQTLPSPHPLTQAQAERRTRIRELTQLCLVWVIWTHSKRFLDWISWAIPFYDELNLALLFWLILMGPSVADSVFRHTINRLVTPYERSLDSILGTTHDILQITIYLITSGPKQLRLKWKKWKAHQFNKSLLSAPTVAPPTRLPVPPPYHPQLHKLKPDNSSEATSTRNPSSTAALTRAGSSTYLVVPQKKPNTSRKLSDGYKRSVSNSRSKGLLCDTALYNTRSASTYRAGYPFRCGPTSTLLTTDWNNPKRSPVHSEISSLRRSSKENMHQSKQGLKQHQGKDDDNNSIIIHDDSMSVHGTDAMPARSIYDPPIRTTRQKRVRNLLDDDALAFRKAKKALRAASAKRIDPAHVSKTETAPLPASDNCSAHVNPTIAQVGQTSIVSSGKKLCPVPNLLVAEDSQALPSSRKTLSNTAYPMKDLGFAPGNAEAPIVRRRLHKHDEPLPLPTLQLSQHEPSTLLSSSPREHEDIREKALNSVRSLMSTSDFPSPSRSNGWLAHRLPTSLTANTTIPTSSASSDISTSTRKGLSRSVEHQRIKTKSSHQFIHSEYLKKHQRPKVLSRKREISGQLGQKKKTLAARKVPPLDPPSHSQIASSSSTALVQESSDPLIVNK